MKRQIAAGRNRACRAACWAAGKRIHREVVRHQGSIKADSLSYDVTNHYCGKCCRRAFVNVQKHDMRGHAERARGGR